MFRKFIFLLLSCSVGFSLSANRPYNDFLYRKVISSLSGYPEAQKAYDPLKFLYDETEKNQDRVDRNYRSGQIFLRFFLGAGWGPDITGGDCRPYFQLKRLWGKYPEIKLVIWGYKNPAYAHLLQDNKTQNSCFIKTLDSRPSALNPNAVSMIGKALKKEEELIKDGYVVCYKEVSPLSGIKYDFTQVCITALEERGQTLFKLPKDFMLLSNQNLVYQLYGNIVGAWMEYSKPTTYEFDSLAAKSFLFSHSFKPCFDLLKNSDSEFEECFERICQDFGFSQVCYKRYRSQFVKLVKDYLNKVPHLSSYGGCLNSSCYSGRLIQIAIPLAKINQCVKYHSAGNLQNVFSQLFSSGISLDKKEDLCLYPIYFRLYHDDYILQPHSGIKIFSYVSCDEQKINETERNAFQRSLRQLADKIAKEKEADSYKNKLYNACLLLTGSSR